LFVKYRSGPRLFVPGHINNQTGLVM